METTFIYLLHNGNDIPLYIGKTNNIKDRYYKHKKKFGSNICIEVLDIVDNNNWKFWECYWISQFKTWGFTLLNKNNGGGGSTNCIFSKERSLKISNKNKGKTSPNKGRKLSKEHKDKIKAKRSYLLNRKNTWSSISVLQYDLNNNFIKEWGSQTQAQLYFNKPKSDGIGACCRGEQKTAYGYKWKFK